MSRPFPPFALPVLLTILAVPTFLTAAEPTPHPGPQTAGKPSGWGVRPALIFHWTKPAYELLAECAATRIAEALGLSLSATSSTAPASSNQAKRAVPPGVIIDRSPDPFPRSTSAHPASPYSPTAIIWLRTISSAPAQVTARRRSSLPKIAVRPGGKWRPWMASGGLRSSFTGVIFIFWAQAKNMGRWSSDAQRMPVERGPAPRTAVAAFCWTMAGITAPVPVVIHKGRIWRKWNTSRDSGVRDSARWSSGEGTVGRPVSATDCPLRGALAVSPGVF